MQVSYLCCVISFLQQVTARDVQGSLIPILQTFHERSMYLNCLLNPATPSLAILQAGLKKKEEKKEDERKEEKGSKGALKLVLYEKYKCPLKVAHNRLQHVSF